MNVFVLCTGRCGSMTFSKACGHISNYTSGHETKTITRKTGSDYFSFPDFSYLNRHIEIDNRLSWFLEELNQMYGNDSFYVHLKRRTINVAKSIRNHRNCDAYLKRWYKKEILIHYPQLFAGTISNNERLSLCADYCNAVNSNIQLFLRDKSNKMNFLLENAKQSFSKFWVTIGAEGNIRKALNEWDIKYNATKR